MSEAVPIPDAVATVFVTVAFVPEGQEPPEGALPAGTFYVGVNMTDGDVDAVVDRLKNALVRGVNKAFLYGGPLVRDEE